MPSMTAATSAKATKGRLAVNLRARNVSSSLILSSAARPRLGLKPRLGLLRFAITQTRFHAFPATHHLVLIPDHPRFDVIGDVRLFAAEDDHPVAQAHDLLKVVRDQHH